MYKVVWLSACVSGSGVCLDLFICFSNASHKLITKMLNFYLIIYCARTRLFYYKINFAF